MEFKTAAWSDELYPALQELVEIHESVNALYRKIMCQAWRRKDLDSMKPIVMLDITEAMTVMDQGQVVWDSSRVKAKEGGEAAT